MQRHTSFLARTVSMLLAALLVLASMGTVQEVCTIAVAKADHHGTAPALTDVPRLVIRFALYAARSRTFSGSS